MCRFYLFLCYAIWLPSLCIQYVYCDEFEDIVQQCLKKVKSLDFPIEIVNDNGALELWFKYNDKYDLYQTYNNGHIYHSELQLNEKISPRTGADRANCSNYLLPTPNSYGCPYTLTEDDNRVNVTLEIFAPTVVYSFDNSTNTLDYMTYTPKVIYSFDKSTNKLDYISDTTGELDSDTEQSRMNCINEVTAYSVPLPMEVIRKENHLEVTVKYREKFDFYNTIDLGTICGIQYQLDEKPNPTVEEYAHCSKCGTFASYFSCPYKIIENENDIEISLEAFFYINIYRINKSTMEISYEKSLSGIDPVQSFESDINKCNNGLAEKNVSIPVQIIRNDNFLEIWVKNNDKYDVFETDVSGTICKRNLQSTREPNVLVPRPPAECFLRLDIPYYFTCPYDILEDDEYVYFKIVSTDQYLYAFKKSSEDLVYRKFPTYLPGINLGTVSYLRSVVKYPNVLLSLP